MKIESKIALSGKIVEHKVILDLSPEATYSGTSQWRDLDLHQGGKWYCSYQGFLDAAQMEELRANYEVKENVVSPLFQTLNEKVRHLDDPRNAEELRRILGF
jgi:hypothetical protein